ncbi:ABC transporter substrate-binding protein [Paralimibaculum aggregatum]|uniref:ABC transporter substrate-binding protein n=1 Tax=Paralimibaculum aggregatum TaxID=3036245 RepID=A0ABQ6LL67_9RHOB|nr:ABC transporter substrate-binding protein [Limibaculum sp. NKW23]GMG83727.1 ABC transporter substrate-binding protein [Limibaculum sp. NKW23]
MRASGYAALGAATALACALAGPAQAGKANDTLVWSTDREVAVVDPYYNNTRELVIMGHLGWDALLFRNLETGEYEPLLATEWEWVDNMTMDITLREGVSFHDGTSFGPEDVAYTVNHVVAEDSGVLTIKNVNWMKSAEVTGDNTVRIHLNAPFPAALAYMAGAVFIVPEGHYDSAPVGADGKKDYAAVAPVGTGPYKAVDVKAGEYVHWEANPDYFAGGPKGSPAISKIHFRTLKEPNTQIAELLTGGIDWIWDVPKDQAERLEETGQITVANAKTMRISYMAFDVEGTSGTDVFTNPKVRQAVAHAINRESITRNLVGPASVVIHAACHPDQFGCTDDVPQWEYDPEKAKALLAEAGYPDGFEFDIYAYRQREFTEAVIGDLARVGIKAKLTFLQYRALRDLVWEGKAPINHMTWGSNSIPDISASTSHFFSGGRDDPAKDEEVIALLKEGDTTTDPAVRKEVYKKALSKISGELYWLPMFTYAKYYAFSQDLNFEPTSDEIPRFYAASWK